MKRVSTQMEHKTAPVYELEMESEKSLRSPESRTYPLSLIDNSYILETKLFDKSEQVKLLIELEGIGSGGDGYYPPILRHEQISDENFESSLNQPDEQQKIRSTASSAQYTNFAASGPSSGENNCQLQSRALQNYVDIPDTVVPPRAEAVLPSILQIRRGIIAPRRALPACARFGPVQGIRNTITMQEAESLKLQAYSSKTPLFLLRDDNNIILIDVTDKDKSNWIGLLPLGDEESANIWIYEENKALYAVTTDTVLSRKPLKLGYSKKYAQNYGLTGPSKDIEAVPPVEKKAWWCKECQRSMPSSYLLQRHMDMYHKEDSQVPRRKYRCRQCTKTFCRLFTLRRHMARHCTKKVVNSENENKILNVDTETQASLNAMLNSEDNRIPSDESFQNFSNGLDFSTNLFDTDRIPSLDISVRSEGDFNPYAIGYKDDNSLANVLDVPQNGYDEAMQKKCEQILVTCPYCNQVVVKEKKRQHVSECSARRYECECKKVFTSKRLLSNHIYTQHSNEGKYEHAKEDETTTKSVDSQDIIVTQPLQCDQCQRVFKRRGMLVNHLWQVHKTVSSAPLERRIRHYPCVACPVIYRTAAKRDRHVKMRHPEATLVRGLSLEGGTRLLPAAACGACPRQYATRAKLLQHQRQRHPHLVQPARKTKKNGNGSKNSVIQVQPDTLADFNYSC